MSYLKAKITRLSCLLICIFRIAFTLLLTQSLFAQKSPKLANPAKQENELPYTRYRQGDQHHLLETSIVSYHPPAVTERKSARGERIVAETIDLIAAVHIADPSYYEDLNERFKTYDAVLFEMVGDGSTRTPKELANRPSSAVGKFQKGLQNLLGLTFQLDAVRYDAANFVHADMSKETFTAEQTKQGENLFTLVQRAAENQDSSNSHSLTMTDLFRVLSSPQMQNELKRVIAPQLASADTLIQHIEGDTGSVILSGRNEVVLEKLTEVLASGKQRIAIFYGAAHMPGIAELLENNMNMIRGKTEWLVGWEIPNEESPQTPLATP